jgi:hypothetical protein
LTVVSSLAYYRRQMPIIAGKSGNHDVSPPGQSGRRPMGGGN